MRKGPWLIIISSFIIGNVSMYGNSESKSREYFDKFRVAPASFRKTPFGNDYIHYADTGEEDLPLAIFVHGTPGSWEAFRSYFKSPEMRGTIRMVALDRPGFGKSNSGKLILTLKKQAEAIRPLLKLNRSGKKTLLIGHSLGGPIIARVAMDFPDEVDGLLLVAPTLDPELERTKWYQTLGRYTLVKWIVPKPLSKANKELENLKSELEKMLPLWGRIQAKAIVIQGAKDSLVNPGNVDFAKRMLPEEQIEIWLHDDLNHFILWTRPDLIKKGILDLL